MHRHLVYSSHPQLRRKLRDDLAISQLSKESVQRFVHRFTLLAPGVNHLTASFGFFKAINQGMELRLVGFLIDCYRSILGNGLLKHPIAKLYSYMDEEEMASWSMEAAQELVADQYRYEIEHGYVLGHYDPADFYEVISEFIRQDTEL